MIIPHNLCRLFVGMLWGVGDAAPYRLRYTLGFPLRGSCHRQVTEEVFYIFSSYLIRHSVTPSPLRGRLNSVIRINYAVRSYIPWAVEDARPYRLCHTLRLVVGGGVPDAPHSPYIPLIFPNPQSGAYCVQKYRS